MSDDLGALLAAPAVRTIGLAGVVGLIALWLAAAWWAYENAVRRTGHGAAAFVAAGWILVSTPLLLPLALAIYALARPGASASERRITALAAELVAVTKAGPVCPGCRDDVHLRKLVGLFVNLVPGVLDRVAHSIARTGDLVAQRLVAVGLAPGLLRIGRGLPNFALDFAHLTSPFFHGGRRARLEPSHRRLLDASWAPVSELQPDLIDSTRPTGGAPS